MTPNISELVERLEGAEAGSRELDWLVADATDHPAFEKRFENMWPPFGEGSKLDVSILRYTTSLDAALALAERVLPGANWRIDFAAHSTHSRTIVEIEGNEARGTGTGNTPALALCIATLKALAARDGSRPAQEPVVPTEPVSTPVLVCKNCGTVARCGCSDHDGTPPVWAELHAPTQPEDGPEAWQPIETAPKDGADIVAISGNGVEIMHWHDGLGGPGWLDDSGAAQHDYWNYVGATPTHWMPLPAPPSQDQNRNLGGDEGEAGVNKAPPIVPGVREAVERLDHSSRSIMAKAMAMRFQNAPGKIPWDRLNPGAQDSLVGTAMFAIEDALAALNAFRGSGHE